MAYHKPNDIDSFIVQMGKADMRLRAQLAEDLVTYLTDSENSIECTDLGTLIDGLMPWLTGSHFKIAQRALEAFTELIGRLGHDFSAYTPSVLPHVVDRLGDSRDIVREKAQLLLRKLMESRVLTPQQLLDKLTPCFKHKNAKIREEFLQTIVITLNEYESQALSLKAFIPAIVSLLSDPTATVREEAIQTLVEIYKHVGDKLKIDLRKREVPASKMALLEQKFDDVRNDGLLLPSASQGNFNADEPDATPAPRTKLVKRTVSASSARKPLSLDVPTGDAGAVTWETFEASFENVPQINVFTQKDIDDNIKNINAIIGNKNMDWEKRVDALKRIRSLLMINVQNTATFPQHLKDLSISYSDLLKELRSQVIREGCITIAYMCKTLRSKLDIFCVFIVQEMIDLVQNSAKVISTSGVVALKYVIKYVHAPKLVPIITQNLMQSKSKDMRAILSELLNLLFDEWTTKSMERYAPQLKEVIKKGISDADSDARKFSRRGFWALRKHFPDHADQLFNTLDPSIQRAVERERDIAERRQSSGLRSPAAALPSAGFRSISAVDTAAVQRARVRAQYSNMARAKVTSGTASLPRAKKLATSMASPQQSSPEHRSIVQRTSRAGVSQSQPTSRSTSPSSRINSAYSVYSAYRQTGAVPKKSSIPRSLAGSRETSPTRSHLSSYKRVPSSGYATHSPRRTDRPPINPGRAPVMAQKMLQQTLEAEQALADVLSPDDGDMSSDFSRLTLNRKISKEESDESEASSVCSERSFDSLRRGNDSYSWNGSRSRLDSFRAPIEDIESIIHYCASTHWSERKDGLVSLTTYLSDGKELTSTQLSMVLDLFRKMFMDTHTKVYALFLDAVNELILRHSNDLHEWLFILLTRLFNKLGTDLLTSMVAKIWKTLKLVYEYFPADWQMHCVFRIITDNAQTPSAKTRLTQFSFLSNLATTYCSAAEFSSQPPAEKAIFKVVQAAHEPKHQDLRGAARVCIVALYNCNPSTVTIFLSNLPKDLQDTCKVIIQQHLRRSTSGTSSPSSPLSCSSPKPLLSPQQGPFSLQNNSSPRSRQSSVEATDHMNTEDVYKSLRKTTAEIQNYSFERGIGRDTNSKDSGISQMGDHGTEHIIMAANGINGHLDLEKEDSCNGSKSQSATTTESNTPESTVRLDALGSGDGNHKISTSQRNLHFTFAENGELVTEKGLYESEIIKAAIILNEFTSEEIIEQCLFNLSICIKFGNGELPYKNFKAIMKMLLQQLDSPSYKVVIYALGVLSKIMRRPNMKTLWIALLELLLLKIIDLYKTPEVSREIDLIIPLIAAVLPLDASINILMPVICTGQYPMNLCGVKLLNELADKQGAELTDNHLSNIMPALASLTDNCQSMVRKAAVFCIVKFYVVMGEDKVKPYFRLFNSSKLRLLNVYIQKAQVKKSS